TATGLFNLLAFLLVAAHGVTVWIARARQRAAGVQHPVPVSRWLAVAGVATAALSPLLAAGFGQRKQISWLERPGPGAVSHLVVSFAGSQPLVPLLGLLMLTGVIATVADRPRAPLGVATVAVPWLVLAAVALLAAPQLRPVHD